MITDERPRDEEPELERLRRLAGNAPAICQWCKEPLTLSRGSGWVHAGGAIYIQKCGECGATYDRPDLAYSCPECGSRDMRDDHCAQPVRS